MRRSVADSLAANTVLATTPDTVSHATITQLAAIYYSDTISFYLAAIGSV